MINITVRHLRYFKALADLRHFGRAASACGISQPALSVQMKDLEEILGAPLIEKGRRKIDLTGLGVEFAIRARKILSTVDELGDLARASHNPLLGRLRFGVIPTVAPYILPKVIGELTKQYPGLNLHPREAVTQDLIADLLDGHLDTAIVALPISEPSLHEEVLFDEEFFLVRPLSEAEEPVPDARALSKMQLLLLEEGHCFRDQALSVCGITSPLPNSMIECSSLSTLVQLVGAGIGVTLIPEMAVNVEISSTPVVLNRFASPRPSRTIGMVWRKTNPLSDQLKHIAGYCQVVF